MTTKLFVASQSFSKVSKSALPQTFCTIAGVENMTAYTLSADHLGNTSFSLIRRTLQHLPHSYKHEAV